MSFDQAAAAYAFEQLVMHLQMRSDVQNIEMMILSGFCRNCLSKWYHAGTARAGQPISYDAACEQVYGMSYKEWKKTHQSAASEEQLRRLEETKSGHAKHEPMPTLQSVLPKPSTATTVEMTKQLTEQSSDVVLTRPHADRVPSTRFLSDVCCEPVSEMPPEMPPETGFGPVTGFGPELGFGRETTAPSPHSEIRQSEICHETPRWSQLAQPDAEVEIRLGRLTVSDRAYHGVYEDVSGAEILRCMHAYALSAGVRWRLVDTQDEIVRDDRCEIEDTMREWCDEGEGTCNLIISTGGTGLAPRDVTPEATLAVCDRTVPALSEYVFRETLQREPLAALSRAVAGVRGHSLIVNLPGRPKAVREHMAVLMPLLAHALQELRVCKESTDSVNRGST